MTLSRPAERSQMAFTHDTELSLSATAALVNTGRAPVEEMADVAALDQFIADWEWTGSRTHDKAELAAVLRLRSLRGGRAARPNTRPRRFCGPPCPNRVNVAAYRSRRTAS